MKFPSILLCIISLTILAGCATVKPQPTGGSRSDGTVELSYQDSSMVKTKVDMSEARSNARERCQSWGYDDAEPFGGEKRQCQSSGPYGCDSWTVTLTYQCTKNE
ncbi:YecR family lipoprotein [Thiohalospira sp.]|uniref:YecR family lipoprotein n=1 Tax=Thiohalospira sp. TaxID=3080549 RepID=UPI0039817AB7